MQPSLTAAGQPSHVTAGDQCQTGKVTGLQSALSQFPQLKNPAEIHSKFENKSSSYHAVKVSSEFWVIVWYLLAKQLNVQAHSAGCLLTDVFSLSRSPLTISLFSQNLDDT